MRLLPWLALAISLVLASTANARLFWQTFGSTVPSADGCGCSWNVNQDYFIPRHSSSCRYGLFSACKTSCTTSPACKWCHPLYPGYCSIYGPWHYHRRDHIYKCRCGCTPHCIARPVRACKGGCEPCVNGGCSSAGCCCIARGGAPSAVCFESPVAQLYNVEPIGVDVLGSIPVEGGDILAQTDFSQLGGANSQLLLQPQGALQQLQNLPSINLPQFSQPESRK